MSKLEEYKDILKEIINGISNILNVECAIFDIDAKLIISTDTYLKRKGTSVHTPSIEEVITNGNVLVNKPGHMKSCFGCRFKDHCPATIELLNCISIEEHPMGVIAITSFTKSGHDRIMQNVGTYTKILNDLTDMIANMVAYKDSIIRTLMLEKALQCALDFSLDSMIVIDSSGYVSYGNSYAMKLFSMCSLYTLTLQQIFPEHMSNRIMGGESFSGKPIKINNQYLFVSCKPTMHEDKFLGAVIRLSQNNQIKSNRKSLDKQIFNSTLEEIKGESPIILSIKSKVRKIANSTSTVLISGETGTGKGLLAKAIHYESIRANNPFITVNCACIPQSLFESELFGYEEGAFTGAKKGGKPGWFELAQNGTLFLDEIGEMPFPMQVKLLEVLQDFTIERIGGISTIPLNVRIIAATNKELEDLIKENKFREDLYYRLNVIPIHLPPLFERKEDINILAHEFLKKYNFKLNRNIHGFSNEVMEFFYNYSWPGNVRELENIVEYAANMTEGIITLDDIPQKYLKIKRDNSPSIKSKVENIEYEIIKAALDKHGWDVKGKSAAAEELGIGLRTLYRKLKNYEETIAN